MQAYPNSEVESWCVGRQPPQQEMKAHTSGILEDTGPLWTPAAPHTLQGRGIHPDWCLLSPHNYMRKNGKVQPLQASTTQYLLPGATVGKTSSTLMHIWYPWIRHTHKRCVHWHTTQTTGAALNESHISTIAKMSFSLFIWSASSCTRLLSLSFSNPKLTTMSWACFSLHSEEDSSTHTHILKRNHIFLKCMYEHSIGKVQAQCKVVMWHVNDVRTLC